jgi:hypothetical protein
MLPYFDLKYLPFQVTIAQIVRPTYLKEVAKSGQDENLPNYRLRKKV